MKFIVTGGAGFIGFSFIKKILENKKNKILNIDKLTYASNKKEIKKFIKYDNYQFKNIDICDFSKLNKIFLKFKPNYVLNFAAETHVDNSIMSSEAFIKSNYIGTYNLLRCSQNYFAKINKKNKFIYFQISTDEVFGFLKKNENKFTEDNLLKPSSPYSASKAGADLLVKSWKLTYNLPTLISHCSNNYGPFQNKEKLIPKTIYSCINKNNIPIYGNGKQIREWIFVEDHVDAILHLLKFGKIGETYNIGSNYEIENIKLVKKICSIYKKLSKSSYDYKSLIKFVKDRPGHDFRYALNTKKLKKIGWKSKFNFEKSLSNTISWYIDRLKNET